MEIKQIFNIIKNKPKIDYEFEVRFGYFTNNKSFIPGIKPNVFETLRNIYNYKNHKYQVIETKYYENFPGVMIESIQEGLWKYRNLKRIKKTFIKNKQKIKNIDNYKFNIRYALNKEIYQYPELNPDMMKRIEKQKPSMIRLKERHIIPLDNNFELHITKTLQNEKLKYEVEIEFKGELKDEKNIQNRLLQYIKDINKIIKISFIFKKILESIFNRFPKNLNQILNKPSTLNKKHLPTIAMNYTVTDKADGIRHLLIIDRVGMAYLVDNNFILKYVDTFSSYKNCIFDGEYLEKSKKFMIFDCIQFKNKNVTDKKLFYRLFCVNDFVNNIKNNLIKSKIFYVELKYLKEQDKTFVKKLNNVKVPKDYSSFLIYLWNKRRNIFNYNLDGLIFTPIDGSYLDPKKPIFKWKDEHTIDVRVQFDNKNKVWKFDVNRFGKKPDYLKITYRPSKDKINETFNLKNGDIVEFLYSDKMKKWLPYRKRTDKKLPNARLTVDGVFEAIEENIKIKDLANIDLKNFGQRYYQESNETLKQRKYAIDYPMRKFHNYVKTQLIKFNSKDKKFLLDLAVGKGGDLMKWKNAGYKVILGIDVSKKSLNEFKKRIKNVKGLEIYMVHGDSTKDIRSGECAYDEEGKKTLKTFFKKYPNIKFDKIVCNFAIHYMFMDDKDRKGKERISQFFTNIKKLLSDNGNFVGTMLSGNKLDKILNKKNEIVSKKNNKEFYKIKKVEPFYKKPDKKLTFSQIFNSKFYKNQVIISREGWEQDIPENIVYESILSLIAKYHGLSKVDDFKKFEEYYNPSFRMSGGEKKISFLHKTFIFEKIDKLLIVAKHYNIKTKNRQEICKKLKEIIKQKNK